MLLDYAGGPPIYLHGSEGAQLSKRSQTGGNVTTEAEGKICRSTRLAVMLEDGDLGKQERTTKLVFPWASMGIGLLTSARGRLISDFWPPDMCNCWCPKTTVLAVICHSCHRMAHFLGVLCIQLTPREARDSLPSPVSEKPKPKMPG